MIARRLAVACLFAALAPAAAREKNDGATLQFRIHGSILWPARWVPAALGGSVGQQNTFAE